MIYPENEKKKQTFHSYFPSRQKQSVFIIYTYNFTAGRIFPLNLTGDKYFFDNARVLSLSLDKVSRW